MDPDKRYEPQHYETVMLLQEVLAGTYQNHSYYLQPGSDRTSECLMLTLRGTFINPLKGIPNHAPVRFHFATIKGQLKLRLMKTEETLTLSKWQSCTLMSDELAYIYPNIGHIFWYGIWYWEML